MASWKLFTNEGKNKRYKVNTYPQYYYYTSKDVEPTGYRWTSDLKDHHHYIYAKLRKRDITRSFSEESLKKVNNHLAYYVNKIGKENNTEQMIKYIGLLKAPFGPEMTDAMLLELIQ